MTNKLICVPTDIPGGVWLRSVELTEREVDARQRYVDAWRHWCLTSDQAMRQVYRLIMDDCQPEIADGPLDPKWEQFIETLGPEYKNFWDEVFAERRRVLSRMLGTDGDPS